MQMTPIYDNFKRILKLEFAAEIKEDYLELENLEKLYRIKEDKAKEERARERRNTKLAIIVALKNDWYAVQAKTVGLHVIESGMRATNQARKLKGEMPAYKDEEFNKIAKEMDALINEMETLAIEIYSWSCSVYPKMESMIADKEKVKDKK